MREPTGSYRTAQNGGYLHRLTADVIPHPATYAPPRPDEQLAPIERRDAVYRAMGRHRAACLSRLDREELARRGLEPDAITAAAYFTLPTRERSAIARDLAEGYELAGVPGFLWSEHNGGYMTLAGRTAALAIPVRDHAGRVRAVKLRPHRQTTDGPKYVALSSRGKRGGSSPGAPLHWSALGSDAEALGITEGELKADVAGALSGWRFVGLPGVQKGRLVEELAEAGWDRAKPLLLALDYADLGTNEHVRRGAVTIGRALVEAGYRVEVLSWDPTLAKGVDDALAAGATITRTPWAEFAGERPPTQRERDVPAEETATDAAEVLTIEEAEAAIAGLVTQLVADAPKGLHTIETAPGVGKTRGTLETLARLRESGPWPVVWDHEAKRGVPARVAFLVDTIDKAAEVAADLRAAGLQEERLAILDGRRETNCNHHAEVRRLGEHRHSPEFELCRDCPEGGGCGCPYIKQRDRARSAEFVVACKEAALCKTTKDLSGFLFVVADESFSADLLEDFTVTVGHAETWARELAALENGGGLDPAEVPEGCRPILEVLRAVLAGTYHEGQERNPWRPARETLRSVAGVLGVDLEAAVRSVRRAKKPRGGRYPFEDPAAWSPQDGRSLKADLPLRGFRDLVEILAEELADSDRTDTRVWYELDQQGKARGERVVGRLRVYRPRAEVAKTLRARTVLLLDATPEPDLPAYRWAFGPEGITRHRFEVPEPLEVVQLGNAIRQTPRVRDAIRRQEAARCGTGEFVAVLTRKRIADTEAEANTDERLRFGTWGRQHRAVNTFSGARTVILEDRWSEPAETARAWVQAWRYGRPPEMDPEPWSPIEGQPVEGRRAGADAETDSDVLAYTEARWAAEVRQAAGRARAVRHATPEHPVRVIVESRLPLPGVPVSRFCTAWEFLGWTRTPNRVGRADDEWIAENIRQRVEAEARVRTAILQHLAQHGRLPSMRSVRDAVGGHRERINRVLEEVRATLARSVPEGLTGVGTPASTDICTYTAGVPTPVRDPAPPEEPSREQAPEPPAKPRTGRKTAAIGTLAPMSPRKNRPDARGERLGPPPRAVSVACRGGGGARW